VTRQRLAGLAATFVSVAALTGSSLFAITTADARPVTSHRAALPFTAVSIDDAGHVTLPATLRPGLRQIKVTATKRREAAFIHLKAGYTLDELVADLNASFTSEQPDLPALNRFYDQTVIPGGIVARPDHPGVGRLTFAKGKYYAFYPTFPIATDDFTPFMVTGDPTGATAPVTPKIVAEHDDFWRRTPASIPSSGWLKFSNIAESPHFIELAKLAPGKTYADFKQWVRDIKAGKDVPPPFGRFALDEGVVSPGHAYSFKYDIPKGDYVVLCFMPDRKTGMPHAFMGMHRPLTVK